MPIATWLKQEDHLGVEFKHLPRQCTVSIKKKKRMKRIQHRKREKFLLKHFQKLLGIHSIVWIRKHDSTFHRR